MLSAAAAAGAVVLVFLLAVLLRRARSGKGATVRVPSSVARPNASVGTAAAALNVAPLEAARSAASLKLWKIAFGAPVQPPPLVKAHARVRDLIHAVLEVDTLDANYFPRRPSLMPQLMQAIDDPNAASERLSRIIAHDPVLTADVLRLANSSLYRISPAPIESIQRAVVVCGVDALRGILATAMLRPVFRASRSNFPRLPRMLWERTERAARAAELYAATSSPEDRFEAQLIVLLSALGPLVVYSAALDGYSRAPQLTPNPTLFVDLVAALSQKMSVRIARDWQTSPRLIAVLEQPAESPLASAFRVGELLGTLSLLESQAVISSPERIEIVNNAGIPGAVADPIWMRLAGAGVTAN